MRLLRFAAIILVALPSYAFFDVVGDTAASTGTWVNTPSMIYPGGDLMQIVKGGGFWNFTNYLYKYIRFNFTTPTAGGLDFDAFLNWRK